MKENIKKAIFASGWFWSPDAQFGVLDGILQTRVGYSSGEEKNPTYENIKDHSECVEILYDSNVIKYKDLLKILKSTYNSSYASVMKQYASIIFYQEEEEKKEAIEFLASLKKPNFTQIKKMSDFYLAENYHQKYYLQLNKELFKDIRSNFNSYEEALFSKTSSRINGYLTGKGNLKLFLSQEKELKISDKMKIRLKNIVESYDPNSDVIIWRNNKKNIEQKNFLKLNVVFWTN